MINVLSLETILKFDLLAFQTTILKINTSLNEIIRVLILYYS